MYAYNTLGKRRPTSWAERRRYFRRLLAKTEPPSAQDGRKKRAS